MTLSSFRAQPHPGHLDQVRRVYGYLCKLKDAEICMRTGKTDYSNLHTEEYDWTKMVYGDVTGIIPKDAPKPCGKYITLSHYVNANLYHDMLTGQSVTGILHFLNQTPVDWYSKKQATVETATYSSKLVSARLAVDQIVDL